MNDASTKRQTLHMDTASVGPARAAENEGGVELGALSFGPSTVDATAGDATATLDRTVTDGDASAAAVSGDVYVRQVSADGSAVGPAFDISYALKPDGSATTDSESGNAQSSTYRYDFTVPQYAARTSATWKVVRVTASDDPGTQRAVADHGDRLLIPQVPEAWRPDGPPRFSWTALTPERRAPRSAGAAARAAPSRSAPVRPRRRVRRTASPRR